MYVSRAARKNLRLFVAVYPPADVTRALLDELAGLELPDHRLVPPRQVHMTLHFIGDTPPQELEATIETVRRSTGGLLIFSLAPRRLITLPPRRRARLVAAEAEGPAALLELQRRLVRRLARAARRNPGDRFRPHLTLCRFKAPAAIAAIDQPIAVAPFPVRQIELMRSTLTAQGAQHEAVASFPLAPPRDHHGPGHGSAGCS